MNPIAEQLRSPIASRRLAAQKKVKEYEAQSEADKKSGSEAVGEAEAKFKRTFGEDRKVPKTRAEWAQGLDEIRSSGGEGTAQEEAYISIGRQRRWEMPTTDAEWQAIEKELGGG